jgi:hypothetical protein
VQLRSSVDLETRSIGKLADPFAGSFNATRTPPQYEKRQKRRAAVASPPLTPKRVRQRQDMSDEQHQFDKSMPLIYHVQPSPKREKTALEKEKEEWYKMEQEIYDFNMRVIDVS